MRFNEMTFTGDEVRTIYVVLDQMRDFGWEKSRLGTITWREMLELSSKIRCYDYCKRNGIKYEEMTDDDFLEAALEDARAQGYEV